MKLTIDYSTLSDFQTCHEKGRLSFVERLQPVIPPGPPEFGRLVHHGVRRFHEGAALDDILRELTDLCSRSAAPPGRWSVASVVDVVRQYADRWHDDTLETLRVGGKPAVEVPFAITLAVEDELTLELVGIIDRLATDGYRVLVIDTKVTSSGWRFEENLRPNNQLTAYALAVTVLYRQPAMAGLDVIYVSTSAKDGPKARDFARHWTRISDQDMVLFIDSARATARELAAHLRERPEGPWCLNAPTGCRLYGECRYRPICASHRNPQIIASLFSRRTTDERDALLRVELTADEEVRT